MRTPCRQELETLFHRVNNAFVQRLMLGYCGENFPLLDCLRSNGGELHCRVKTLYVAVVDVEIDNALLIFVGTYFAPQIYVACMVMTTSCSSHIMLCAEALNT